MSGPGAPQAQEGTTPGIPVWHVFSSNLITQRVNSSALQIVNVTEEGHLLDPGQIEWQVTPTSPSTSDVTLTGTGTTRFWLWNDIVGLLYFSRAVGSVADLCAAADAGMGYPGT